MYFPYGYKKTRAIELGQLVLKAYDQFECFTSNATWTLSEGYSLLKEISIGSTHNTHDSFPDIIQSIFSSKKERNAPIGFIAKKNNALYIIFRGTQTPSEWMSNINAVLKPYEYGGTGNVHNGFLELYKSIRETIIETIEKEGNKKNIHIAGHSLGAAIATLSVMDIGQNQNNNIKSVYLYGSPRVGDAAYVNDYNKKYRDITYRIVNTSDIVTSVPPPVPVIGSIGGYFSHIDTAIDFNWQENDILKNHKMDKYLEEIKNTKEGLLLRIIRKGA